MTLQARYLNRSRQCGAALLAALLVVVMVTSLTATAHWQQWRGTELEQAQRLRLQATWILTGALDWARLALREDAKHSSYDHLAEGWAVPLKRVSLTTFLVADPAQAHSTEHIPEALLSGRIVDLQSRLNLANLVQGGEINQPAKIAFSRLFGLLKLPASELDTLVERLLMTQVAPASASLSRPVLLRPQYLSHLTWTGISPFAVNVLSPYVTSLPVPTAINLNTAAEEILYASIPGISLAEARRLVASRKSKPFADLGAALASLGNNAIEFDRRQHGVDSSFFEVVADLWFEQASVREIAVLQRSGLDVLTLLRMRVQPQVPTASQDVGKIE